MIAETQAVILNSRKYGDSSKIISCYSRDYGKLSLIAKAARQTKSKFGSALSPLSVSSISFYNKLNRELHPLSNAEIIIPLNRISNSLEHAGFGLMALESVSQTQEGHEPNPQLFSSLVESIVRLDRLEVKPELDLFSFLIKLSEIMGFAINPEFSEELDFDSYLYYSYTSGNLNKRNSGNTQDLYSNDFFRLSGLTVKIMDAIVHSQTREEQVKLLKHEVNSKVRNELVSFFSSYFSFHLEKKFYFRAYEIVKNINNDS